MIRQSPGIPIEIGRANQHDLKIIWQDGHESVFPARGLRLACPCASCVDEMTGEIRIIPSRIADDIRPLGVHLVGRYAISLDWSDGHRTGIYPFEFLRKRCPCCQPPRCDGSGGSCGCQHADSGHTHQS